MYSALNRLHLGRCLQQGYLDTKLAEVNGLCVTRTPGNYAIIQMPGLQERVCAAIHIPAEMGNRWEHADAGILLSSESANRWHGVQVQSVLSVLRTDVKF